MKLIKWLVLAVILILIVGIGFWLYRHHKSTVATDTEKKTTESADTTASSDTTDENASGEKKVEAVASVRIIPLKESTIEETATLYGTIIAATQHLKTYNVPFECQVKQIHVTLGQIVQKGDNLVDIEPSLAEKLELKQAQNDAQATLATLKKVKERLELHLVTRQDLLTAQQATDQAKLKLDSLLQEGIETNHKIKATDFGIINQLDIQNGQIIPGNTVLVSIANNNNLEAKLGIDPEKVNSIKVGQSVLLSQVNRPTAGEVKETIRLLTHKINPDTRLVDFYVSLPQKHSFLISDFVTGKISIRSAKGFVVPRDAVLPAEDGYELFTIQNGKAVHHQVQTGLENDKQIQVLGKDLKSGDSVVIQGNYELEDGMAVDTTETK